MLITYSRLLHGIVKHMTWQLLTAISVISLAVSVILQRILLHKDKVDPFAYAVVFQGIVGALLMGCALIRGFSLPGIETVLWPAAIATLAFGAGHIVYAKTLQHVEASTFSVLFATQAIWIMALGIMLFNERLSWLQLAGSLLIFGAVLLVVKNIRTFKLDKGTLLGLLTGLLFGIAITAWSYVGRHTDGFSWAALSFVAAALTALALRPKTARTFGPLFRPRIMRHLLLLAVFYAIGSVTMLYAYTEGSFAVVSPLRQTSIIVTVLLALAFLPAERNRIVTKLLAASICFAGILLILL
jgi:drug/metabolite transporter (DMT)-like permease